MSGKKLDTYMTKHFAETWANYDVNDEGEITLEEAHTFQRALMGRLNQFVLAAGSVSDLNSTPLNSLIDDSTTADSS